MALFLLSYLWVAGRTRADVLKVGVGFVAGVFLAYMALGLGLFEIISRLGAFRLFSKALYPAVALLSLLLALGHARDWAAKRRGRKMRLGMSASASAQAHRAIRRFTAARALILGAFLTGLVVSALEFGCTGQVYIPTLAYVVRETRQWPEALGWLGLYNLVFVLPLVVLFSLAGSKGAVYRMADWVALKVPAAKLALAGLFVAAAAYFGVVSYRMWCG